MHASTILIPVPLTTLALVLPSSAGPFPTTTSTPSARSSPAVPTTTTALTLRGKASDRLFSDSDGNSDDKDAPATIVSRRKRALQKTVTKFLRDLSYTAPRERLHARDGREGTRVGIASSSTRASGSLAARDIESDFKNWYHDNIYCAQESNPCEDTGE